MRSRMIEEEKEEEALEEGQIEKNAVNESLPEVTAERKGHWVRPQDNRREQMRGEVEEKRT